VLIVFVPLEGSLQGLQKNASFSSLQHHLSLFSSHKLKLGENTLASRLELIFSNSAPQKQTCNDTPRAMTAPAGIVFRPLFNESKIPTLIDY